LAGRAAFAAAKQDGVIDTDSVNFTSVGGKPEAELEDLYNEETFQEFLKIETGLDWSAKGADNKKKWTERVRNLLRRAGKPYDDATLRAIKIKIAEAAADRGQDCLHPSKIRPIVSLSESLVHKLGNAVF